jgi:tRNA pseudouridine38-40 synthase
MARYQVLLAYDGSDFAGYQRQANARTVQSEVETALRELGWGGRSILAAGRTDTGVHALGQVIAFDLDWRHNPQDLVQALNARLPADAAVQQARIVPPDFHPRYAATGRTYFYRLVCREERQPLLERYAWRVWPAVDLERMRQASRDLLGAHDFAAFGSPPKAGGSTLRSLTQADWRVEAGCTVFEVTGNAFLYRMVRRMTALLVAIGQGSQEPEAVRQALEAPQAGMIQGLAPAHGLTLAAVHYPPAIREQPGWEHAPGPYDVRNLSGSGD